MREEARKNNRVRYPRIRFLWNCMLTYMVASTLASLFYIQATLREASDILFEVGNRFEAIGRIQDRKKKSPQDSSSRNKSAFRTDLSTETTGNTTSSNQFKSGENANTNTMVHKNWKFDMKFGGNDGFNFNLKLEDESQEGKLRKKRRKEREDTLASFQSLVLLIYLAILFWYINPICKIINNKGTPEDKVKGRARVVRLQAFHLYSFWSLSVVLLLLRLYFQPEHLDKVSTTVIILETYLGFGFVATAMILTWMDRFHIRLVPLVFEEENLFDAKEGSVTVSLRYRFLILILVCSVIPMTCALIGIALGSPFFDELTFLTTYKPQNMQEKAEMIRKIPFIVVVFFQFFLFLFSLLMTFLVTSSFSEGILKPLQSVIDRMHAVSKGDYEQRTTVFSNDEIGQLKSHFNSMLDGLKQREFIRSTFGRYLGEEISKEILSSESINLGGEEREATILFCDIVGFTNLSESLSAKEVVEMINELFSHIVTPISEHKGVVNKYIGDCVMAIFGVPAHKEDHQEQAVQASIEMLRALKELNQIRAERSQMPLQIGIGLHSGKVVAGNIGASDRMEYTVIGDAVNVASRVEGQSRVLGSSLVISEQVYDSLTDLMKSLNWERCEDISLKGKQEKYTLYAYREKSL